MYFTPRDAIKFRKNRVKNQQMNAPNIATALYQHYKRPNLNNSVIASNSYGG